MLRCPLCLLIVAIFLAWAEFAQAQDNGRQTGDDACAVRDNDARGGGAAHGAARDRDRRAGNAAYRVAREDRRRAGGAAAQAARPAPASRLSGTWIWSCQASIWMPNCFIPPC